MLTPDDYKRAIDVQNACNLSGVAHSLSEVMKKISTDLGTEARNHHPIVVMYVAKMADLCGLEIREYSNTMFHSAYRVCKLEAAK